MFFAVARRRLIPTTTWLQISGIAVQVTRKRMKTLRLAVYPPMGEVRISAPHHLGDQKIIEWVGRRLSWIAKQRDKIAQRPAEVKAEFVSGERHPFMGQELVLQLIDKDCRPQIRQDGEILNLIAPASLQIQQRAALLERWYRQRLMEQVTPLMTHWQQVLQVNCRSWRVRKMRRRWGSCHTRRTDIWFSLELAKQPLVSIEYVVVHELVHLLEPSHNRRFYAIMTKYLPDWRQRQRHLNYPTRMETNIAKSNT